MQSYIKYIDTLYLFQFIPRSRRETIRYLGFTEENIEKIYKFHKTEAGGDSEANFARLCGCSLFSGIKYDVHLDLDESNKSPKKRQIPIIFELDMGKPLLQ